MTMQTAEEKKPRSIITTMVIIDPVRITGARDGPSTFDLSPTSGTRSRRNDRRRARRSSNGR